MWPQDLGPDEERREREGESTLVPSALKVLLKSRSHNWCWYLGSRHTSHAAVLLCHIKLKLWIFFSNVMVSSPITIAYKISCVAVLSLEQRTSGTSHPPSETTAGIFPTHRHTRSTETKHDSVDQLPRSTIFNYILKQWKPRHLHGTTVQSLSIDWPQQQPSRHNVIRKFVSITFHRANTKQWDTACFYWCYSLSCTRVADGLIYMIWRRTAYVWSAEV